jgi:hypothetical protein
MNQCRRYGRALRGTDASCLNFRGAGSERDEKVSGGFSPASCSKILKSITFQTRIGSIRIVAI